MPLAQQFAGLLADADALKAAMATSGINQHCHAALHDFTAKLESFALAVASLEAKPADKTK